MLNYKLFQVKDDLTLEFGFKGLDFLQTIGLELNLNNYDLVYESVVGTNEDYTLEALFSKFNLEHPNDFYGRSMSVSDIVQIEDDYYYCDSIGWKNINDILKL